MITLNHTWVGLIGHIMRDNVITRVQIKQCKVLDCKAVAIDVVFFERGKVKHKLVHPLTLYCCYLLWLSSDIVSDDEDELRTDVVPQLTRALPPLVIDKTNLSHEDATLVQWNEKQILGLSRLLP